MDTSAPVVLEVPLPAIYADQQDDITAMTQLVGDLEAQDPTLKTVEWLSFPLLNATGVTADHRLDPTEQPGQPTDYLYRLPWCMALLHTLATCGLTIAHARLLLLRPGGMFWPHCDAHGYFRLLVPLASDPGHCLYLSGTQLFQATVGTGYYFQPDAVHAAFNFGDHVRAVVCVDSVANRTALDFAAVVGSRPQAHTARIPHSTVLEHVLAQIIQGVAEYDALLASKLAFLLSSFCVEIPIPHMYRLIHAGLMQCNPERMSTLQRQHLTEVRQLIEQHPFFPREGCIAARQEQLAVALEHMK